MTYTSCAGRRASYASLCSLRPERSLANTGDRPPSPRFFASSGAAGMCTARVRPVDWRSRFEAGGAFHLASWTLQRPFRSARNDSTVCSAAPGGSESSQSRSSSGSPAPPFSPSKHPKTVNPAGGDPAPASRSTATDAMASQRLVAPAGDAEDSNGKAPSNASKANASDVPVRRRRGRPPGIPAWNKNKKMSAKTREKISKTKKAQWKDPEYRKAYKAFSTAGLEPWNKGKAMSAETRERMADAKRGKTLPKAVKRKLSLAHSRRPGPGHTPETRAALSAKLSGKSKSPAHRAAIAAGQRRRSAAARVLAAVEGVHRELSARQASNGGQSSSYEAAAKRSGLGGSGSSYSSATPTKAQLLGAYKAQLHEYRNLQEELQPWTTAFTNKEGRKPSLRDVEATGIDWLIVKYKQYMLLREHLLREIPSLRQAGGDPAAYGGAASAPGRSSNSVMGSPSTREAASRMQLAMDYRQKMLLRQQSKSPAGASVADEGSAESDIQESAEQQQDEEDRLRNMISSSSSGTNQRASSALQAALAYREDKAKLNSAKARAAAAMAGGGSQAAAQPSGSRKSNKDMDGKESE